MLLRPVIASYSGQSYAAIRQTLDARALDLVARIAQAPVPTSQVDEELLHALVAMHVLAPQDGMVRLDTAVFLADDIRALAPTVAALSQGLADALADAMADLRPEPPEVVNLLVGIIGIGQSLGHALKASGAAVDWQSYAGPYAQSKVDFDEQCDALTATGADLQTKTVLRGARYTAVFIGPGGASYSLRVAADHTPTEAAHLRALNAYLTDAYARLIIGELHDGALKACAESVGLYRDGVPATTVLTSARMARHLPTLERLAQITQVYVVGRLDEMQRMLQTTRCGRQGVPVANMMLNLWRYLRKGIARQLYARGVFTDAVPESGLITVFFENKIEALSGLLR